MDAYNCVLSDSTSEKCFDGVPQPFLCENSTEENKSVPSSILDSVEEGPRPGVSRGGHRHYTAKQKAWRGQYCCVPLCHSSSGEKAERERLGMQRLSFHSFPDVSSDKGKMWIAKIRRDPGPNFVINSNTKVCSLHFTLDDYISGDVLHSARRVLKATSVPSVFPWTREMQQRTTTTSRLAASVYQRADMIETRGEGQGTPVDSDWSEENFMEVGGNSIDVAEMQRRIDELQVKLSEVENAFQRSLFRLENICDNDEFVKFYTGFSDYNTLIAFYEEVLESDAKVMRQWEGKNSKDDYDDTKTGRTCKLPLLEQFFLTLVRLHLGLLELDLAKRFRISKSSVSRIVSTWINLMFHSLKALERYPRWHIVKKYMPEVFKKDYPNTRLIIDATEFPIERPSSLLSQSCTFSSYKNRNTVKVLVGIMPSGVVTFVSPTYEGSISDRKLVEVSGLLDLLETGDEIMADKGFQIQDLLAPLGVRLNIPPLLSSNTQMPVDDVFHTRKIAHLRIHVERAIGRAKQFHILQHTLPASMWDSINELVYVCFMLTNFSPPLVA
ncbi:uncharacterized protein [Dysidea avara]|uniref:uncharacterized protein n=1 Tax=Dysidea avara TaxID=196820 RepID=UPI00331A1679